MKNKKFYEFSSGQAGSGKIDLETGAVTFVHQTTNPESNILPIAVSHVYKNQTNSNNFYGIGFGLNLQQTLKQTNDDGTHWEYTDAEGTVHRLEQRFYHRVNGSKVFVQPSAIKINLDGKLTLASDGNVEISQETITHSGLALELRAFPNKNFQGFDKIENHAKHEELVQVKEEINQINRNISDLRFNITQFERSLNEENKALHDLQKDIEKDSLAMEDRAIEHFKEMRLTQETLLKTNRRKLLALMNRAPNQSIGSFTLRTDNPNWINRVYDFHFDGKGYGLTDSDGHLAEHIANQARFNNNLSAVDTHNGINASGEDPNNRPRRHQATLRAQAFFQQKYDEKVNEQNQIISNTSLELEIDNFNNQVASNNDRENLLEKQKNLATRRQVLDKIEFDETYWRNTDLLRIVKIDIEKLEIRLAFAEFMEKLLRSKIPVNSIIIDTLSFGFNEFHLNLGFLRQ